jgi:hypothetical protein
MAKHLNVAMGFLAMVATLVIVPASVTLVRDSLERRDAIAVLRTARTFEIRDSQILNRGLYEIDRQRDSESASGLQLVSIVAGQTEVEAVLRVWASVKEGSVVNRSAMSVLVFEVGEKPQLAGVPPGIAVRRIKKVEAFTTRTGIRVIPFSLIMTAGDKILAAGPGLPDAAFVHDAAERFVREGANAATRFRNVTPELNSTLISIDALFQSNGMRTVP